MFGKDKDNNKDEQKRPNTRRAAKAGPVSSASAPVTTPANASGAAAAAIIRANTRAQAKKANIANSASTTENVAKPAISGGSAQTRNTTKVTSSSSTAPHVSALSAQMSGPHGKQELGDAWKGLTEAQLVLFLKTAAAEALKRLYGNTNKKFPKKAKSEIGPRVLDGWGLQDVSGDGNCFYYAVAHQLRALQHPLVNAIPVGKALHRVLRERVQGDNFKDRAWADYEDILKLSASIRIVVAIVDTRAPQNFMYHYVDRGRPNSTNDPAQLPNGMPIVKIAYTGNHYLSVTSHPRLVNAEPMQLSGVPSSVAVSTIASTSSNISSAPLSLEEQGRLLAQSLIAELQFPGDMPAHIKSQLVEPLLPSPPPRKKLGFQQHVHEHPGLHDTPKAHLASELADQEVLKEARSLFCAAHGEFTSISGTDIEHAMAFDIIKENQAQFLEFLNDPHNDTVVEAFLTTPGISDFFRRDPSELRPDSQKGLVKGTQYFYKICFNNVDNIWLMCHACNIQKSNKEELLDWFGKQEKYFGPAFVRQAEKEGGLQQGIIFIKVGGKLSGATLNGRPVYVDGTGIGAFAMEFFKKHHREAFLLNRQCYGIVYQEHQKRIEALDKLIQEKGSQDPEVIRERGDLNNLIQIQIALLKTAPEIAKKVHADSPPVVGIASSSVIGVSPQAAIRAQNRILDFWEGEAKARAFNRVRDFLHAYFPADTAAIRDYLETLKAEAEERNNGIDLDETREFCTTIQRHMKSAHPPNTWPKLQAFIEKRRQTFGEAAKGRVTILGLEEITENLTKKFEEEHAKRVLSEQKAEEARKAQEAADKRAEEARKAQEAADKRAEKARKAQEAADQRAEKAERQLKELALLLQAPLTGGLQQPAISTTTSVPASVQQQIQAVPPVSAPMVSFSNRPGTRVTRKVAAAVPNTQNATPTAESRSQQLRAGTTDRNRKGQETERKESKASRPGRKK